MIIVLELTGAEFLLQRERGREKDWGKKMCGQNPRVTGLRSVGAADQIVGYTISAMFVMNRNSKKKATIPPQTYV